MERALVDISPTFCKLPWTNINTTPQGNCKLCCNIADERNIMDWRTVPRTMDWSQDTLAEIWNGSYMQDVRRKMLRGERVHDCEGCYQAEAMGNVSSRMATNSDEFYTVDGGYDVVARHMPMSFELRLTNRCNLTCHSCWGGSSSRVLELRRDAIDLNENSELVMPVWLRKTWKGEVDKLSRKDRNYAKTEDYVTQPTSIENFAGMAPGLRRLYITGGEPTMDRTIHTYLDHLIAVGNHDCFVGWTTNCTLWNEQLMERLGEFRHNELQLSMDAHGEANEYIRRPTMWDDVDSNMRRYLVDPRVKAIKVFTVTGALNAAVLPPLLDYLREACNASGRRAIWWPIQLRFPEWQDIAVLDAAARSAIAADLSLYLDGAQDDDDLLDYRDGLTNVINQLRNAPQVDGHVLRSQLREYLDYSDRLDALRGGGTRDWRASLPHMEDLI